MSHKKSVTIDMAKKHLQQNPNDIDVLRADLIKVISVAEEVIKQKSIPIEGIWSFAMYMKGWQEHSSKEYFYKSKDRNQWPPDETATKEELINRFFFAETFHLNQNNH